MKFSIGDKILVKRTDEEGIVTAYINQQMLEVEVNGTRFPVHTDEIDHPYLKWFTQKKPAKAKPTPPEQLPVEKEKYRKPRIAKGIYLSFLPVFKPDVMDDIVDHLKVYMLNETPWNIRFEYEVRLPSEVLFTHTGKLHAFGHVYLHNIPYDQMNDQPRFHWQIENTDNDFAIAKDVLRIRPVKLFEQVNQLLLKNEPSFEYMLLEEFSEKKAETPPPAPIAKPAPAVRHSKPSKMSLHDLPRYELDLHIEQLVDSTKGLSNADMLTTQLSVLNRYLHLAILHRQQSMIIIHGLGKGVLRDEVHKILKETPEVARFSDGWHGKYGFGATEVWFKY